MRFVTVLIVLTLAAAVYVANSAPDPGRGSGGSSAPSPGGAGPDSPASKEPRDEYDVGLAEVPTSFPEELEQRSGAGFTPLEVTNPLDEIVEQPLVLDESEEDNPFLRGKDGEVEGIAPATGGADEVSIAMPDGLLDDPAPGATSSGNSIPEEPAGTAGDDEIILPRVELPGAGGSAAPAERTATAGAGDAPSAQGATQGTTQGTTQGAASITGTVAGPRGGGIRGVELIARSQSGRVELARAKSDRAGRYEFKGLDDGAVLLEVVASSVPLGYAAPVAVESCRTGKEPAGYGSTCVEVVRGRAPGAVDVELPYSSGVEGVVKDTAGKPSKGAIVRAVSTLSGFESVRVVVTTDDSGSYFLPLVPGPYQLQILLPGEEEQARRFAVEPKAGEALILEAIDFSKPQVDDEGSQADGAGSAMIPSDPLPVMASVMAPEPEASEPAAAARPVVSVPSHDTASEPAPAPAVPLVAAPDSPNAPEPATGKTRRRLRNRVAIGPQGLPVKTPPARSRRPAGAVSRAFKASVDEGPKPLKGSGPVTLEGRVISTWGEAVDGVWVACLDERGIRVAFGPTDPQGRYSLAGTPVGGTQIQVAPDAPIGTRSLQGFVLRERPRSVPALSSEGQRTVIVDDIVVDVAPVFRVDGKIEVDDATLRAYRDELAESHPALAELGMDRIRRAYLRGLSLVRQDGLGPGRDKSINIGPRGEFEWQCNLPARDAVLVLSARAARPSDVYGGPVGVVVTPAGVRTRELVIRYPGGPEPEPQPAVEPSAPQAHVQGTETADAGH